jgi:hypothetical protein
MVILFHLPMSSEVSIPCEEDFEAPSCILRKTCSLAAAWWIMEERISVLRPLPLYLNLGKKTEKREHTNCRWIRELELHST